MKDWAVKKRGNLMSEKTKGILCIIFSAFASASTPNIDTSITTVTMIWKYIGEVIFNILILVGIIKGADRIVKEMLGT